MSGRVLVACVGNVLRGDDGFGVAVAEHLAATGGLAGEVDVVETGIGGMEIIHRLMDGYAALIVVDAVDESQRPGTLLLLEPELADPAEIGLEKWRTLFSNLHLAEPSRVLLLAKSLGVLPERVLVLACQAGDCERVGEGLTPPVQAAVPLAAARIRELVSGVVDAPLTGGS